MMKIDGLPVKHKIVSPACHRTHGKIAAGLIAIDELQKAYEEFVLLPANKDVKWHFVLTMERD